MPDLPLSGNLFFSRDVIFNVTLLTTATYWWRRKNLFPNPIFPGMVDEVFSPLYLIALIF